MSGFNEFFFCFENGVLMEKKSGKVGGQGGLGIHCLSKDIDSNVIP